MKIKLKSISSWFLIIWGIFLILGFSGCKDNNDDNEIYTITYHLNGGQGLDLPHLKLVINLL